MCQSDYLVACNRKGLCLAGGKKIVWGKNMGWLTEFPQRWRIKLNTKGPTVPGGLGSRNQLQDDRARVRSPLHS